MKRIIRRNTFETNSSSTHSLVICTAEQWNEFKTTDNYLADWDGKLFLVDDLIEMMKIEAIKHPDRYKDVDLNSRESCVKCLTEDDYYTYETWGSYDKWSDWGEVYEEHFITPSGDKMVAVGTYGYNS